MSASSETITLQPIWPAASARLQAPEPLRSHQDPSTTLTPPANESSEVETVSRWTPTIIVAASFTIMFTCCGLNFAFGVYQALFEDLSTQPENPFTGASPAEISLIGTFAISLMTIGAPWTVAWAKRFSPRLVSFAGGLIFGLSLVLASFATQLWQFILTQGVLLGIGTCLSYMVAVTVAPSWFTAHRGLAMGIILSGTGVGGVAWAPALKACIDALGYRNTLRLTGAVSAVLVILASTALRWEPVTRARWAAENATRTSRASGLFNVPLIDWRVARTRKFTAQALGAVFQAAGYYVPVFFFASYAQTLGYSATAGANFIAISNACNAIGKIIIGHLADRFGRLNTLFLTTLISGVVTLGFWLPSTLRGETPSAQNMFVAFTILYGIFASAYVALFPTSLMELFGAPHFASVNGALYMVRGIATIIGTPMGGVMVRNAGGPHGGPGSYQGMATLVGALMLAAAAAVFWVRIEAMMGPGRKPTWKLRL